MSNESNSPEYMLLFRGTNWDKGLSPSEIQDVMSRWRAWFQKLLADGKAKAGQPLTSEGKVVSGRQGRVVSDGPFAESKEAIGGYFLLQVDDFEEAVAIAQGCPGLDHGCVVEVRQVAEMCDVNRRLNEQLAGATV